MPTDSRVNQVWFVQVRGERAVRTVKIIDETEKTVCIFTGTRVPTTQRFMKEDVTFVERQPR
jgi:hypothetical protein